MKLRYLGHSAFQLCDGKESVLIDPFLTGNPLAEVKSTDLDPTLILVTHAHGDHLGDAIAISKRADCPILTTFELGNHVASEGGNAIPAHIGGEFSFPFGMVKIFPAVHGSSVDGVNMVGVPCSFIISMSDRVIFHAGDTALFGDMRLIGEEFHIDVALLPVGGVYTMGIRDAMTAMRFLGADIMVPMHYDTFDNIKLDRAAMKELAAKEGFELALLGPGQTMRVERGKGFILMDHEG